MKEVLDAHRDAIEASDVLVRLGLEPGSYFLVSAHREENVDSPQRLDALLDCLQRVYETYGKPILVSTHPRTRKRLDALGRTLEGVTFHPPLGFLDYNKLQLNAACVLSDSGTIAEESSLLGFPAVTLRDAIERPEALDTGAIMMTGLDPDNVIEAVSLAMSREPIVIPDDYQIANTSQRSSVSLCPPCVATSSGVGCAEGAEGAEGAADPSLGSSCQPADSDVLLADSP